MFFKNLRCSKVGTALGAFGLVILFGPARRCFILFFGVGVGFGFGSGSLRGEKSSSSSKKFAATSASVFMVSVSVSALANSAAVLSDI